MTPPTGLVTVVFADVFGPADLWDRFGSRLLPLMGNLNAIVRERIAAHGGYEVKSHAGHFMIAFPNTPAAARFALETQDLLAPLPWPAPLGGSPIRIALHCGTPICEPDPASGRMDYFGPVVNRAARILDAGHPGQILFSAAAAHAADLPSALLTDLGDHRLRGFDTPERIHLAVAPSQAHRKFAPLRAVTALPTNLPGQTASFIGREKELEELTRLLRQSDVVVLSGPPGTGKTRLAVRLGSEMLGQFDGGCWFVDLSPARTAEDVAEAVAQTLGAPARANPVEMGARVLELRRPLLLILDNFEQVASHAEATVGLWRRRAPQVRYLITSRALIGLPGERELRLAPLPAPRHRVESLAQAEAFEAVKLFVDRAREVKPDFVLTEENAADVSQICSDLEGIPLAIELAASRVKIMQPALMVKKLGQKFQLLRSSRQDLGARQQTLTGAMEWSYELLTEWEKSAFHQASVFAGGFLEEAALAVVQMKDGPGAGEAMEALAARSLLARQETPWGKRYVMYRPIREFAEKKLEATDAEARLELEIRHVHWYVKYAETWSSRIGTGAEPRMRLEAEMENLCVAHDRSIERRDRAGGRIGPDTAARAILALGMTRESGYSVLETASRMERTLPLLQALPGVDPALLVRARDSVGLALWSVGRRDEATSSLEKAVREARTLPQPAPELGHALRSYASCFWARGQYDTGIALLRESADVYGRLGDKVGVAFALNGLGVNFLWRSRNTESVEAFLQSEALFRESGFHYGLAMAMSNRALAHQHMGEHTQARRCYEEALANAESLNAVSLICSILSNRAGLDSDEGKLDEALAGFAKAEEVSRRLGERTALSHALANRGVVFLRRAEYEAARTCFEKVEPVMSALEDRPGLSINARNLGVAEWRLGNLGKAKGLMSRGRLLSEEMGDEGGVAECDSYTGRILMDEGRMADAVPLLKSAFETFHRTSTERESSGLYAMGALAVAYEKLGKGAEAVEAARKASEIAEHVVKENMLQDDEMKRLLAEIARIRSSGVSPKP